MGCGCQKNNNGAAIQAQSIQSQQPGMPQAIPTVSSVRSPHNPMGQMNNPTGQVNPHTYQPRINPQPQPMPQRPMATQPYQRAYQPTPNVVGAWGPQKPTESVGPLGPQRPGEPIKIPPLPQQNIPKGLQQAVSVDPEVPPPNITKKPYSVLDAALDTAKAAFGKEGVFAAQDVQKRRMDTCDACPHKKMARCTICGCVLDLKVRYDQSSCPINKW